MGDDEGGFRKRSNTFSSHQSFYRVYRLIITNCGMTGYQCRGEGVPANQHLPVTGVYHLAS